MDVSSTSLYVSSILKIYLTTQACSKIQYRDWRKRYPVHHHKRLQYICENDRSLSTPRRIGECLMGLLYDYFKIERAASKIKRGSIWRLRLIALADKTLWTGIVNLQNILERPLGASHLLLDALAFCEFWSTKAMLKTPIIKPIRFRLFIYVIQVWHTS